MADDRFRDRPRDAASAGTEDGPNTALADGTLAIGSSTSLDLAGLYDRHARVVTASIRRLFGNGPPDPEDVTQLAFQKLLERDDRHSIRNPEAFLWRTARNLLLNEKRSQGVRSKYDYDVEQLFFAPGGDKSNPECVVAAREQIHVINQALLAMPEKRRRAFMLHRVEGLNVSEVARRLGLSRTAVNKHLARAFATVDSVLQTLGQDQAP